MAKDTLPNPPDNPGYLLVSYPLVQNWTQPLLQYEKAGYRIVPGTAVVLNGTGYVFMQYGYTQGGNQ
jgi:hypothetical protein